MVFASNRSDGKRNAEDDIREYQVIKWKTLYSAALDHFSDITKQEGYSEDFGDDFIKSVGERSRELQRTYIRFSAVLFLLVLFMGSINSDDIEQIAIFDIRISKDNASFGILLLLSSLLMFFTSHLNLKFAT